MDIVKSIELYQEKSSLRRAKLEDFERGERPFLVIQRPPFGNLWANCNTVKYVVENNLNTIEQHLNFDYTDELPYMEPWLGVGIYANAFGCEYLWRDAEAPATHYKYHTLDEVKGISYPDWKKSPVMQMVIDVIDALNEKTGGKLPIALTDTQSPFDTATLIVDATNFMLGCYEDPETATAFLNQVTDLIIEFSKVQAEHIGKEAFAQPGHIMTGRAYERGISVSDDNLSFCSPDFNAQFSLPFNQRLGKAFGGVAIHSCGVWTHTMNILNQFDQVFMIDCAVSKDCDPGTNDPEAVKEALKGKNLIAKVRTGNDFAATLKHVEKLVDPELKLIIDIGYSGEHAQDNYINLTGRLEQLYQL